MDDQRIKLDFTGEFFVPGKSGERIEADHFERYLFATKYARDKSVLDIACGVGYAGPLFLQSGAKTYEGVDISENLVQYATQTYGRTGIQYSLSDICTFNPKKKYDLITCFETIEHVPSYRAALRNLSALLHENGVLLISSPNRPITSPDAKKLTDKPSNEFHTQEFTPSELISELRAVGLISSTAHLYGQRQRYIFSNYKLNALMAKLFGDPNYKSSPRVRLVRNRVPRYFVLIARKSEQ